MRYGPPPWLSPSAATDLAMLLAGTKPAARLRVGAHRADVRRWARRQGLYASTDRDGYAVLSRSGTTARRVLGVDGRPGRHTMALGRMLGYPECCSRAAARAGEEGIDALAGAISALRFRGRFAAIDPTHYLTGGALLSHVPCSHTCAASATLARGNPRC